MDDDISDFFVHTATIETFAGPTGNGEDTYGPPFTLDPTSGNGCLVEGARKVVLNKDGEEEISETQVYAPASNAGRFLPDSRFTYNGVPSRVITVALHDSGGLDLPDHIAVSLT